MAVIIRPFNLDDTELVHFQLVNSPSMPVAKMKGFQRDEIWVKVVREIKQADISQQAERLTSRAYQLNQSGSYGEAVDVCEQVICLHPQNIYLAKAYRYKAWALNVLGRHQEALDACEQAIHLDPSTAAFAYTNKAWALNGFGRHEEALSACRQALSIRNDADLRASAHRQMKWAFNSLGRYQEAQDL